MKIEVKDHFPGLEKKLKKILKKQIVIGVTEETAPRMNEEITNAFIGDIQDHGNEARSIPERPFLDAGIESIKYDIGLCMAQAIKSALSEKSFFGRPYKRWLNKAGEIGAKGVQDFIKAGNFESLKESTLAKRRARGNYSTAPLIDTGQLLGSITYDVRNKK